jgi:hypothetical protein
MNIKWLGSAFLCTGLLYCGGGSGGGGGGSSGVDQNKTIGELSDSELRDLCEYFADLQPTPERMITCTTPDGDITITFGSNPDELQADIDECVSDAPPNCTATVGEAEACFEAQFGVFEGLSDDEICERLTDETAESPPECEPLMNPDCE